MRPTLVGILLASAFAAGCGLSGTEPYAGWKTATSTAGGYSVRFLAPPWERDETVEEPALRLVVPFQHEVPMGLPAPPPAYSLDVEIAPEGTSAEEAIGEAEAEMTARGDTILAPPRMFDTRSLLVGHEVISLDSVPRYHRVAYLALPSGATLHILAESNDDIDDRDMDDLFASFSAAAWTAP